MAALCSTQTDEVVAGHLIESIIRVVKIFGPAHPMVDLVAAVAVRRIRLGEQLRLERQRRGAWLIAEPALTAALQTEKEIR